MGESKRSIVYAFRHIPCGGRPIDFKQTVKDIEELYLNDDRPWTIGFSGGKDSTVVVQLVYYMLKGLPKSKRKKQIHILSSDTLVESPFIEKRLKTTCRKIEQQARKDDIPMKIKIVKPELNDTWWVNLIGRGYPSPNRWFRWCTDRLKIKPMTKYTLEQIKENGEVIILLGARKSESASRAQTMGKYEIKDFKLRKNASIPGAYIFTPIEDWVFQDVWSYLFQAPSPWGDDNKELVTLYRKTDSECPLVIDKSTPACGGSRFGCWTCTVVDRDRALEGLIEDGHTWLEPLLEYRNWLKEIRDDPKMRESVRKRDKKRKFIVEYSGREFERPKHRGHEMMGPFTFEARHEMLKRLIELQQGLQEHDLSLISPEEIKAIETLWIYEGDTISSIAEVLGIQNGNGHLQSEREKFERLEKICAKNDISPELIGRLLIVENDLSNLSRRKGIYRRLETVLDEYIMQTVVNGNGESE